MAKKTTKKTTKKKAKKFSTYNNNLVRQLSEEGCAVQSQAIVDGKLLYVFKEDEAKVKKIMGGAHE